MTMAPRDSVPQPRRGELPRISISRASLLDDSARAALYGLHCRYFDNTTPDRFATDLNGKEWVIRALDETGDPIAFSTLRTIPALTDEGTAAFLFSGDTIVDKNVWHRNVLAPAVAVFIERFMREYASVPCYWFLISKGYRTYRSLPVFFNEFFPTYAAPTPDRESRLLGWIAREMFGRHYDAERGIISFDLPHDYLCRELAEPAPGKNRDPHVQFFLEKNPGFVRGDELACLARLSWDNLNRVARRMIAYGRRVVRWDE